jgi:phosphoribosylglycinamide formyltransferase-1
VADPFRIGVLISGTGTNLQALIDAFPRGSAVDIVGVVSSRVDAPGLERARAAGIETTVLAIADHPDRAARDAALAAWLEERRVELVVLAGFMELLGPELTARFAGRLVNVHPSLLPAFPGVGAIEQASSTGSRRSG